LYIDLLLDRIPVSSVSGATVRTLKPKNLENLNLKKLWFLPALQISLSSMWGCMKF